MTNLILNIIANNSANTIKEIMDYVAPGKSYLSKERQDVRKYLEELQSENKIVKEFVKVQDTEYLVPSYKLTDTFSITFAEI